ncbi:MAG: hypothetical protein RDU14_11050 [Melioribacteraceae bacterium]|nr:hypothetical protein [Melioribacteraceae bacterium]
MKSVIGILSIISLIFISCSSEDVTSPENQKHELKSLTYEINKALYEPPRIEYIDEVLSITKEWNGQYGWVADSYIADNYGQIGGFIEAVGSTLRAFDIYVIDIYKNYEKVSTYSIEAPYSGSIGWIYASPGSIITVKITAVTPGNTNSYGSCTAKIGYVLLY